MRQIPGMGGYEEEQSWDMAWNLLFPAGGEGHGQLHTIYLGPMLTNSLLWQVVEF